MPRWIKPTEAHLRAYLSDVEIENLRASLSDTDKMDTVAMVIDAAVGIVRGKIAANRVNKLARGATVPPSLLRHAMALAVMDAMSRPASSIVDASGTRKAAADRAYTELDKVASAAKDAMRIEAPDDAEVETSDRWNRPGAAVILEAKTALLTRDTLDGL